MSRVNENTTIREQPLENKKVFWGLMAAIPVLVAAGVLTTARMEQTKLNEPVSNAVPMVTTINAVGTLEPKGEIIKLSAPTGLQGAARVDKLMVNEGQQVSKGEVIAVLDSFAGNRAALEQARANLQESRANLAKFQLGSPRDIEAQLAAIAQLKAQLRGEINTTQATIARIQAQISGEKVAQQATIGRVQAELEGEAETLRATIARTQAEARNAATDAQRYQTLYREGAISQQERDRRSLIAQTSSQQVIESQATRRQAISTLQQQLIEARAIRSKTIATLEQQLVEAQANRDKIVATLQKQIEQETANLNRIQDVRPSNVQIAQAQVNNAIAMVQKAEADLKLSYVTAPIAGEILEIYTQPGEIMGTNGIAEIGRTSEMIVVAEVPEDSIRKVRLGQLATITSDNGAFSGQLQGTVAEIGRKIGKKDVLNTDPAADIDARVVEVKIALTLEDSKQVAGLTNAKVIVDIDTD